MRKSDTRMKADYDQAIAVIERPWHNGTKLDFFRPAIEESQKRWKSGAEAQCRLEDGHHGDRARGRIEGKRGW